MTNPGLAALLDGSHRLSQRRRGYACLSLQGRLVIFLLALVLQLTPHPSPRLWRPLLPPSARQHRGSSYLGCFRHHLAFGLGEYDDEEVRDVIQEIKILEERRLATCCTAQPPVLLAGGPRPGKASPAWGAGAL